MQQPAIELFQSLGYSYLDCFHEIFGEKGTLGRETSTDVVLISKLRQALIKLYPSMPPEAIDLAIEELTRTLLLPKLISGEIDVEEIDIKINGEVAA